MTVFAVKKDDKPLLTPAKRALALPGQALADAVAQEWKTQKTFNPQSMPLTALAFTAIDRIAGQEADVVEALLAYVDTDTLSYYSEREELKQDQQGQWGPLMAWVEKEFGGAWLVTGGVMPIAQSIAVQQSMRAYLTSLDALRLAAACVLASGFSSLALALAVLKGRLDAGQAFTLSRLEEEYQARHWGADDEMAQRAEKLKQDILAAERFLRLLEAA